MGERKLPPAYNIAIPEPAKRAAWAYFWDHEGEVVFSAFGFVKVRLGQLKGLWTTIFGPEPAKFSE